ncbi:MAG: hypothetical protein LQ349_004900 [Xanthoria aureola]|nr:MAG: hypothetical protein LQ349_004900 [Xanthoria aureola]
MAFQTPGAFACLTTVTADLWPLVNSNLTSPWKILRQSSVSAKSCSPNVHKEHFSSAAEAARRTGTQLPEHPYKIPDCLNSVPLRALRTYSIDYTLNSHDVSRMVAIPSSATCRSANVYSARPSSNRRLSRMYSTMRPFTMHDDATNVRSKFLSPIQRRTIFGMGSSQNLLAHMEQTANNNPTSATAQNAFYSALLRANMPAIIVERYQTGRYASNPACEATYHRALESVGQSGGLATSQGTSYAGVPQGNLGMTPEQLQAVGQAVAAQSRGGNISVTGKGGAAGTGAKDTPLYVVVEESLGSSIFKWVKFIFYFGLVGYFTLVIMTIAVEASGILKKVGGFQTTEAQPQDQTTRFSDVHGCDEAKEELQEVVQFLKDPAKFSTLGGKLPKGVLLVGPPGTGKTLLARAVAGEAGVPFFYMSGSEFDEIYVGVGAKRVRELFTNARAKSPAIIFIDELDAIGAKRNDRDPAYVKQSLNQLLTEMDGFSQDTGVIVIAATNLPRMLDKALTRPGRFDRNIDVPLPDVRGRMEILKNKMKKVQIGTDVDESTIARGTPGFSGAELENLINQAAVRASKNQQPKVTMLDFEWAKDKIMMGSERRSMVVQEKDKLMTAYHEGGHALVALKTKGATPLYKVTIMPRGPTLGVTHFMYEMDKVSQTKLELMSAIDVSMGGKVAEELVYGADNVTTGASADIQNATSTARHMVTQCGMSDLLGNIDLASNYDLHSSDTKAKIEAEVRRLVEEGRERATRLLSENRKELDIIAKALMEYEVLSLEEVQKVLKGEKLPKLASKSAAPLKLPDLVLPTGSLPGQSSSQGEVGQARGSNDSSSTSGGDGGAKL